MATDPHALCRRLADAYMETYPLGMRLGSNYNSLVPMLIDGLSRRYFSRDMFSKCQWAMKNGTWTVEPTLLARETINSVFRSTDTIVMLDHIPEIYIAKQNTLCMSLSFELSNVFDAGDDAMRVRPDKDPGELHGREPIRKGTTGQSKMKVNVPMMVGSFDSMADSDGQSGLFIKKGYEQLYTMQFEDSANRMVVALGAGNSVSVMFASQKLGEVSRKRSDPESTVRAIRMQILPTKGVMISTAMPTKNVSSAHNTVQSEATLAMMPIAIYIDSLLHHVEGRRITARDFEALFAGLETIADIPYEDGSLAPVGERERFKAIVSNLRETSSYSLPWAGSEPAQFPFTYKEGEVSTRGGVLFRELFPHIERDEPLGATGDETGATRLGFLRRMLSEGLCALYGFTQVDRSSLMQHKKKTPDMDRMDLRSLRVITPEHEVFIHTRREVFDGIRNGIRKDVEAQDASNTAHWGVISDRDTKQYSPKTDSIIDIFFSADKGGNKTVIRGGNAHRDGELRKSFANYLQKLFIIKYSMSSEKDPKVNNRRQHSSLCGTICGSDTPSNSNVGREMSPNHASMISTHVSPFDILGHPRVAGLIETLVPGAFGDRYTVTINGVAVGACADPVALRNAVRAVRMHRIEHKNPCDPGGVDTYRPFQSIGVHVEHEIVPVNGVYQRRPRVCIRTDGGRFYKGMLFLEGLAACDPGLLERADVYGLIDAGVIEFLDVDEQQSACVRASPTLWDAVAGRHTHADIHPSLLYGVLVSLIPHSKNNHGVKNTGMCNHLKSVMHPMSIKHANCFDRLFYTGFNNAQPVIQTNGYRYCSGADHPHGFNVLLAMCTFRGMNQEDACVVKRSARDRGLGFGCSNRTKIYDAMPDEINVVQRHVGQTFRPDDILLGTIGREREYERAGSEESGVVADIRIVEGDGGRKRYYMTVVCEHVPQPGDKFTSPHAQKGVIGEVCDDMDMPYTAGGLRPDVIINPHAIPSRMTVAQLKEMASGNVAVATGEIQREFTYDETGNEALLDTLAEHARALGVDSLEAAGVREFFDPHTGEPIPARIFIGVCYYSRLKHLVDEKVRSNDAVGSRTNPITRQADVGRKIKGGLKIGEMESFGITGHGGVFTKQEMFRNNSDGMRASIDCLDEETGMYMFRPNPTDAIASSKTIDTNYSILAVEQILNSCMLGISMHVKNDVAERDLEVAAEAQRTQRLE